MGSGWISSSTVDVSTLQETIDGLNGSITGTNSQIDELSGTMVEDAAVATDTYATAAQDVVTNLQSLQDQYDALWQSTYDALSQTVSQWAAMKTETNQDVTAVTGDLQTQITWENIETLCGLLNCQPGDIVEYAPGLRG